ncbi:MAG: MFS transporter [Anaerolineae bacterium]
MRRNAAMLADRERDASRLWIARLLCLSYYAALATVAVYKVLYFRRVGLAETEIGVLIGLPPLVGLVAGPAWSLIADRFGIRERLFTLLVGLSILPTLAMVWSQSFVALIVWSAVGALFSGPVLPLLDTIILDALGRERHRYASVRGVGSLGYAGALWLTGLFVQGRDIRWAFGFSAALLLLALVLSLRLRVETRILPRSLAGGVRSLVRNRMWQVFMAAAFVSAILDSVAFNYMSLYLDTLGSSEGLIGIAGALGSVTQTLLMWLVLPHLLHNWGSQRLLVLALGVFAVRLLTWALFPSVWAIIATQVLMGLSFGATAVAVVDLADRSAPEGMAATSQSAAGVVSSLGASFGGSAGGAMYQGIGPSATFVTFGALAVLSSGVFGLLWRKPSSKAVQMMPASPE